MGMFAIIDETGIIEKNQKEEILKLWKKLENFQYDRCELLGVNEINGSLKLVEIKDYLS